MINYYLTQYSIILKLTNMKLVIRFMLLFGFVLVTNTSFAVSSSVLNPPIELTTEKQSFKEKANNFYKKHVENRVKKQFKKIKDSWNLYKQERKKGAGFSTIFLLLLTATFVVLKILEIITWSWLWVLSPLWIPLGLTILLVIVALIGVSAMKN